MQTIEQIWKDYHSKLHHFVNKRVGDYTQSDDIVQDIMIKINSKMDTLQSKEKIQGWIYQIARNTIIDYYRANKSEVELPEHLVAQESDHIKQARLEIIGCLNPLIQNLPIQYRDAITLSEMEGFTQKEVASQQGISLSGAKSRVQRGRGMLKDMLMQCCAFEKDNKNHVIDYQRKKNCGC